jgi:ELWxxDGT repeat protein
VTNRRELIERLESRQLLSVSLVKDLNPSESGSNGPLPSVWDVEPVSGFTYLSAIDTTAGWELYRTDGTEAGTTLIKDIRPGRDNSQAGGFAHIGGNIVLFTADDGVNGFELWRSDGTAAGTFLVKDINPGAANGSPQNMISIGGTAFFSATSATGGTELWKSDGTLAGTVQIKDINPGTASSSPTRLIDNNGTLFFRATTAASGAELWKSNGTEAGTVMVKELWSSTSSGLANQAMAVLNGYVYFSGNSSTGNDLWRSDGSDAGTTQVVEVSTSASFTSVSDIEVSGNLIYYSNSNNVGLWRTDAVNPAVQIVNQFPSATVDVNGTLLYGLSGTIYATTGGAPTAIKSGLTFKQFSGQYWSSVNGVAYLPADDGTGLGDELWRSDGTPGGTYMLKDINPGSASSSPGFALAGAGGSSFYFAATRADVGIELFKSDGTEPGTQLVKNIFASTAASGPILLTPFNGKLYFMAFVPGFGETGGELYSSDGTAAGTNIVADIMPGPTGASISSPRVFGNFLYFAANDGTNGKELWRTNGTGAGTTMVANINSGNLNSNPSELTVSGNYLYFAATTTANGEELYRIDQAGNLLRLTDINPLSGNSSIDIWGESNGIVYFTANNASGFTGLWKSDGNSITQLPSASGAFTGLNSTLNVGGWLYIAGTTSTTGTELFKTFGGSTPVLVKDIAASSGSSSPQNLTDVDGTIYFSAIGASNIGRELWKTDGSDAGTVLVKDIASVPF